MKTTVQLFLFIILTALLPAALSAQGNRLVVPYPFTTIQSAIDSAAAGDTVLVYPARYYENIKFSGKKIVVASTFITTGDTARIAETIIDGKDSSSVVIFNNDTTGSELNGFTITNGNSNNGGGIYINNSCPVLNNLNVKDNTAQKDGGGIYIRYSIASLNDLLISGNNSNNNGGGIYNIRSNSTFKNITFSDNYCSEECGGIFIKYSEAILKNIKITNNKAGDLAGGIGVANGTYIISNTEITRNEAGKYCSGLIVGSNSKVYMNNLTVCDNYMADNSDDPEGGIWIADSDVFLVNCIVRDNYPLNLVLREFNNKNTVCEIQHSNIGMDKIYQGELTTLINSGNVVDKDPMFNYSGGSPYSLRPESPCIDAGTPDTAGLGLPETDLAGNIRIRDGRVDMGAYEWDGITSAFPPVPPAWTVNPVEFQTSMKLKGQVIFNNRALQDSFSYVGAFVSGECRGSARIKEITDWTVGIDMEIYGNSAGENVSFKLWNSSYEEEFSLAETVTLTPGDSVGTYDDPFRLSYTFVTAVDEEVKIPESYYLNQNYPNPFNPETNINFALPKQQRVRLIIYDLLGRPVKTLADGTYATGVHSLKWNGRNDAGEQAASGAYIYRIITKDFSNSRKMVFIK